MMSTSTVTTARHTGSLRRAFTLVELLVVIGIIALLVGVLLPVLNTAREQGRQSVCLSNLRQIGIALQMYTQNNNGSLPWVAPYANQSPLPNERTDDWIYWENDRDINQSAIAPYSSQPFSATLFRCPSDDVSWRARIYNNGYGPYRYSYSMNSFLRNMIDPKNSKTWIMHRLTDMAMPSDKLLMYEEDENTIDDGLGTPDVGEINLLAVRHDPKRRRPDNPSTGIALNGNCRGNALFCDIHAEFISRNELHTPHVYDPNSP